MHPHPSTDSVAWPNIIVALLNQARICGFFIEHRSDRVLVVPPTGQSLVWETIMYAPQSVGVESGCCVTRLTDQLEFMRPRQIAIRI